MNGNASLEMLTDFTVAAQSCFESLIREVKSYRAVYRPKHQRVRLKSSGTAQGDEILEMDICIDWQPVEPSAELREEMKAIMVTRMNKHFSALESGEQRAFKILINSLLAQLSICDLMSRQGKCQFQTQYFEDEIADEAICRAERVVNGSVKIAMEITKGERFDMTKMNLLTGETQPMEQVRRD